MEVLVKYQNTKNTSIKFQITNPKHITITEIQNTKQLVLSLFEIWIL